MAGLLLLLAAFPASAVPPQADERVDAEVLAALASGEPVEVIITFDLPEAGPRDRRRTDTPAARAAIQSRADEILNSFGPGEFTLYRRYSVLPSLAGTLRNHGALQRLLANLRVARVEINRYDQVNLDQARPLTNVDSAHSIGAAPGLTGEGVTVAVIDSGIDTDHPDLADDLVAEACFCGPTCCPGGVATASGTGSAEDVNGHGTHVAGIITSKGTVSPLGVAPDAGIVAVRACNPAGCQVADQLAAMNWILDTRPDVDVVNMSLGGGSYAGDCDALQSGRANAIDALRAKGVLFTIASGNNGFVDTMSAPACIKNAISVGNVHDSNYGPSPPSGAWCLNSSCTALCADPTTAADELICSTNASATTDVFAPGAAILSTAMGGGATTKTGTSMASPFTAGCVALMLEQDATLTPEDIEQRLEGTGQLVKDTRAGGGRSYPRIDCRAALEVECFTSQSSDPVWGDPALPLAIPDLAVVESSLASPPFEGRIVDVNVKDLSISHTWVGDLRLQLFTPDLARNAYVIDRVCGSDDDLDLDLDDAAATSIPCPSTDGAVHLPTNALSIFNGYPANTGLPGNRWVLRIEDEFAPDPGTLDAWSLEVCASRACGNGALGADEQCDDGNRQNGDGCSAHCEVEVCNRFDAPAGSLVIPNPGSVTETISVDSGGAITDVDVEDLLGTNTWVGDLVFDLHGPSGSTVNLIDQQCASAQDFSLSLDDEAPAGPVAKDTVCPLTQSGAPFIPNVRLAGFDGQTAAGEWTLEVEDTFWEDGGTLDSWSLRICSAQCAIYRPLDMPQTIPDAGLGSAISKVSVPAGGVISDVNIVDLTGIHTYVQDLEFHLTSPMGTDRAVIDRVCGDPSVGFALQLDDEAATAIPCPNPTDGAAHLPSTALAGFDGENPQGTWQLEVVDQWQEDAGVLESWGLEICFKGCGNGALEAGEACDDGNNADLDGCSAACAVEPPCWNGLDDDGDGLIDAGVDPGCYDVSAASVEDPDCQDGLNNDYGQAGIDFDGGAIANGGVPLDDPDPQCVGKPWRSSEGVSCGLGTELVLLLPALTRLRRRRQGAAAA